MSTQRKRHLLSAAFGVMPADDFAELVADIKKNGLLSSIVYVGSSVDGEILDGWHRYLACLQAGIKPRFEPFDFVVEAAAEGAGRTMTQAEYVCAQNAHRRHLTQAQKRDIIAALLKAEPERSDRAIAGMAKVDHKTVAAVRQKAEATGEIPQLTKTTGADGKARPAKRTAAPAKPPAPITNPHSGPTSRLVLVLDDLEEAAKVLSTCMELAKVERLHELLGQRLEKRRAYRGVDNTPTDPNAGRSIADAANTLASAPESVKQKVERLAAKEIERLRALFQVEVHKAFEARHPEMVASYHQKLEKVNDHAHVLSERAKCIDDYMTQDEFRLLQGCLHPDRQPEGEKEKYGRAFQILKRMESRIDPSKRKRLAKGWA